MAHLCLHDIEAFLDINWRRVDVSHVGHVQPIEGRNALKVVVLTDERRLGADLARPEPGARPIRRAAVERDADDGDVEAARIFDMRQPHEGRWLREAGRFERGARLVRHPEIVVLALGAVGPRSWGPRVIHV